ncbi:hypothetical protein [Chitinophaga flava]|uniref:DUF4595 domain-containing protein n=1 Tax=Chitinophaga flava TaxID=2259036 RepID=A0A365Y047_9BACT|nr:hypothetical protein [Chitinophaga flava]RBL91992.1 hypothetical protein DF182_05175 [Chitinophaga flava]
MKGILLAVAIVSAVAVSCSKSSDTPPKPSQNKMYLALLKGNYDSTIMEYNADMTIKRTANFTIIGPYLNWDALYAYDNAKLASLTFGGVKFDASYDSAGNLSFVDTKNVYDDQHRMIESRIYLGSDKVYSGVDKLTWDGMNLIRIDCYNKDGKLFYVKNYQYDDKINPLRDIPVGTKKWEDPAKYLSGNNIIDEKSEDPNGGYSPHQISRYKYNERNYPVSAEVYSVFEGTNSLMDSLNFTYLR